MKKKMIVTCGLVIGLLMECGNLVAEAHTASTPTVTTKPKNYEWGDELPEFVYDPDVFSYFRGYNGETLTVITENGVYKYAGEATPFVSWEIAGITEDSHLWSFEEAPAQLCILLEDSVVALKENGETEVFLDHVISYGGWDGLMAVYMLNDGQLRHYGQSGDNRITDYVIAEDVIDAKSVCRSDIILFQKADGVYSYAPYDFEGGYEDINEKRFMSGDSGVIKRLKPETLDFYHEWLDERFDQYTQQMSEVYPYDALLNEFSDE